MKKEKNHLKSDEKPIKRHSFLRNWNPLKIEINLINSFSEYNLKWMPIANT